MCKISLGSFKSQVVLLCVWTEGVNKCMRQQLVMVGEEVEAEWQAGRGGGKRGSRRRAVQFFDSGPREGGERGQRTNNDRSYELTRQNGR